MVAPGNNEPTKKSNYDGLSDEIKKVIRDEQFQTTVGKFVRKSNTRFKVLKGIGFTLALASGLFGYFLKANSEADDRKTEIIHRIIEQKREAGVRIANGILDLRKTGYLIKYGCDHKKPISPYSQGKERFLARFELVKSCTGIRELLGDEVFKTCLDLIAFDESITDVCSNIAPGDQEWRDYLIKINKQIHESLIKDREKLEQLGNGALEDVFKVL
jgi:hypothetical protein